MLRALPTRVVVGAGATGGIAARLLAEAGLRVLVSTPVCLQRRFGRSAVGLLSHNIARRLLGSAGPRVLDRLLRSPFTRNIIARRQPIQIALLRMGARAMAICR